jgi:SAM-dependent methyltransferase
METDITKDEIWKTLLQFDFIFSIAVIHHLPTRRDQTFVLEQIKKHLKPGGKCLITAWNLWQPKLLKRRMKNDTKIKDKHVIYIPFQGKPRFHFAHTKPYLEGLLCEVGLDLKVTKTSKNYLISN